MPIDKLWKIDFPELFEVAASTSAERSCSLECPSDADADLALAGTDGGDGDGDGDGDGA